MKLALGLGFQKGEDAVAYDQIQGLQLWLDASDASTIFDATTGGDSPGDVGFSGSVVRWEDKSGNDHHMLGNTNPVYEATGYINNQPCISFDGKSMRAEHAAFKDFEGMTAIYVMQSTADLTANTGTSIGRMFSVGERATDVVTYGGPATGFGQESFAFVHAGNGAGGDIIATGLSRWNFRMDVGDNSVIGWTTGSSGTAFYRGAYSVPLGHHSLNYFGNADADTDFSPSAIGVSNDWISIGGIVINNSGGTLTFGNYKIAEVVIYDRALSSAEYASVVRQLENKWGVQSVQSIDAIITAGQSNAVGHGQQAEAPASYQDVFDGSKIWSVGALVDDLTTATAEGAQTNEFGPELSASRLLKTQTGRDNIVIKTPSGGTSLDVDWKPTPTFGTTLQNALDEIDGALARLPGNGLLPNVKCVLWVQGESDAVNIANGGSQARADAYEQNLTDLIGVFRNNYGNIDFIIAKLNDDLSDSTYPYQSEVITAQENVAAALDKVYTVDVSNLKTEDTVHYDALSLTALGEAMITAHLDGENKVALMDPINIGSLSRWIDFSDEDTVTEADSGGGGDRITLVEDKSPNGFDIAQTTLASGPTYNSFLNGLKVADFSGSFFLEEPGSPASGYFDIVTDDNTYFVIWNDERIADDIIVSFLSSTTDRTSLYRSSTNTLNAVQQGSTSATALSTTVSSSSFSTTLAVVRNNGTTQQLYVFGGTPTSNTTATYDGTADNFNMMEGTLGILGEWIAAERALEDREIDQIANYLADRWNVSWTEIA